MTEQTAAVEVWARMLCAADVHVNDGDHPTWQQLAAMPGRGQDEYRKAARWLLSRLSVGQTAAPSAPADRGAPGMYYCDDCDHAFTAPTDTESCICSCGARAWQEKPADADLHTRIRGVIRDCPALYPDDIADRVLAALPAPADRAARALAEVRRLCEMTIEASVRVDAIHQARDTLAVIDRRMADETQQAAGGSSSPESISPEFKDAAGTLNSSADKQADRVLDERVAAAKEQQAGDGR